MATINSLAPELLSEIFGHLEVYAFGRSFGGKLCRASLVCRRWREPAQRALFQFVKLRSVRQGEAWLQSPARPRYRTRSLTIELGGSEAYPLHLLKACPDLQFLGLDGGADGGEDGGYEWCCSDLVQDLPSLSINSTCKFPTSAAALRLRPLAIRNLRHLTFDIDEELIYNEVVLLPSRHSLVFLLLEALDLVTSAYLLEVLGSQPFPLVRHLALFGLKAFEVWSALSIASFPSLVTLEFGGLQTDIKNALGAAHATPPTPHTLIFTHPLLYAEEGCCADLLRFIKLPSLEALRRIEIAMVPKDELAGESGLALLDECEKRSISLLCRYGYLTRDMMLAAPLRGST